MSAKNSEEGKLRHLLSKLEEQEEGFTGSQIASAYKAALSDFVSRKTTRSAISEVSKLLAGTLAARRQQLAELEDLSTMKIKNFY